MKAGTRRNRSPLRPAWATSQPAFELVTFASVAAGTPAYTIVVFQSNESFRYFEPSIQGTNCSRWRQPSWRRGSVTDPERCPSPCALPKIRPLH